MLLIVRRGQVERFGYLETSFRDEPVDVIWDRRVADRRQRRDAVSVERRQGDRRAETVAPLPSELDSRHATDRRHQEESRMPERRRADRRGPAPVSWTALDFVMVRRVPWDT